MILESVRAIAEALSAMSVTLELPTLTAAHAQALTLLSDDEAGPAEVAAVVESDPALTASTIRAANSASYGWFSRARSARDAIVRIGLVETRRIIAGAAMGSTFRDIERSGIDVGELWRHVVACGLLADATAWGAGSRSEAFTGGMLHDIGRLALAVEDPKRYQRVAALVREGVDAREAETELFGVDHVQWGVQVGEAFRFTQAVVEAIAQHHDGGDAAMAWVTCNGRRLAWSLGFGDGLTEPDHVGFDPESDDAVVLEAVGGLEGLESQVEWYRQAFDAHA